MARSLRGDCMPSAASPDGAEAIYFQQMTKETIIRKVDRMDTEELLTLLGHLILLERRKRTDPKSPLY